MYLEQARTHCGLASLEAQAKPPPALLTSLVMLMLSLNSTEGAAATVDLINKYTFYPTLKSVISLCI